MTEKVKNKRFYGWILVFASIAYLAVLVPGSVSLANTFQVAVSEDFGIPKSAFALSNSILQAMGIFFSPILAQKLSQGNFHRIMRIGILVYILGFVGYGLAPNIYTFYILSVFLGVAFIAVGVIPVSIMISNWFVKSRGVAMSLAFTGISLGGFLLSPIFTASMANFGWRMTYFIYAGICAAVAIPLVYFIFKRNPEEKGLQPYGLDEVNAAKAAQTKSGEKPHKVETLVALPMKEIFGKSFFILLIIGVVANGIINSAALGQFPPAAEIEHGMAFRSMMIQIYSLIGIGGKLLMGWINDKFGIVTHVIFGFGVFTAVFLLMMNAANSTMAILAAALFGLCIAVGSVTNPLLSASIFAPSVNGTAYGYLQSAMQVGMTVGSLLAAGIADVTGTYSTAWLIMAILSAVTLVSWVLAYKGSKKYATAV